MPLESGDYISDLVDTNPDGLDQVSQGDDHLRLIKHVLKTTFPSANEVIDKVLQAQAEDPTNVTQYIWTPQAVEWAIQAALALWTPPAVPGGASASVSKTSSQTLSNANVPEKVIFQRDDWDDKTWMANSRFTPNEVGIYQIIGSLDFDPSSSGQDLEIQIRKNGGIERRINIRHDGSGKTEGVGMSALVDLDGVSDFIEIWGMSSNNNEQIRADPANVFFQAYKVSDSAVGGGGLA